MVVEPNKYTVSLFAPAAQLVTAWLNAVDFVEDTWVVAGNQGTVLASPNTTNWYSFPTITKKSIYGMAIHNGLTVLAGTEGTIIRSRLVPDPTPIRIAGFERASDMNVFLFTGAADQQFRIERSTDLRSWKEGALLEFLDSSGTLIHVEDTGTNAPPASFYRSRRIR